MSSNPNANADLKVGMEFRGKVKTIELYGAFVDIGTGQDALLHVSQLGKVRNVEDVVKVGDEITVFVLKVDKSNGRVALTMNKPPERTWDDIKVGDSARGKVVRIEKFGVFVDIGMERPAMIHVSELAEGYVKSPSDVVKVGDEVEARVLKIDRKKRQVDMSMKPAPQRVEHVVEDDTDDETLTPMALALKKAMAGEKGGSLPFKVGGKMDKRGKRDRQSREQDDIIQRTLRGQKQN